MLYPNASSRGHWIAEILAALNRIQKLRNNNKLPKAKLIYRALSSFNDVTDNIIYQVKQMKKNLTPVDIDAASIVAVAESYQHWLSEALSTLGAVAPDDMFNELKELLK